MGSLNNDSMRGVIGRDNEVRIVVNLYEGTEGIVFVYLFVFVSVVIGIPRVVDKSLDLSI